jgi:hypothetical protein
MRSAPGVIGLCARLTGRALLNPVVAVDLLALVWAFRRRGWWRQFPFLPLPDQDYLAWRMHTAYGEERDLPPLQDVLRFARWRRRILHD